MQNLISIEQLSTILHKSVPTIRSDASRNQDALPPICRLPNTKRLLWRVEDVNQWLSDHVRHNPSTFPTVPTKSILRRGRPRNKKNTSNINQISVHSINTFQSGLL